MPAPHRLRPHRPALALHAVAPAIVLPGCAAMGELAHHGPWAWVAVTVVVLAVVGFIVSRMRR